MATHKTGKLLVRMRKRAKLRNTYHALLSCQTDYQRELDTYATASPGIYESDDPRYIDYLQRNIVRLESARRECIRPA